MTVQIMAWALRTPAVKDPVAKLVLIGLADHARNDGTAAFPSQATLAEYVGCTDRTVRTKLAELEAAGVIRRGDQRLVEHLPGNRRPVVWDVIVTETGRNEVPAGNPVRADARRTPGRKTASDKPPYEPHYSSREEFSPVQAAPEPPPNDHDEVRAVSPLTRPDRCARHQHDDVAPPCGGCRDARQRHEEYAAAEEAARRQAAQQEARQRRAEARRLRRLDIDACDLCDDDGRDPSGLPCHHDPDVRERARRGLASVRAALEKPAVAS